MRRVLPALLVLATAAAAASLPATSAGAAADDGARRGSEAVRSLGDRLPAVAKAYGTDAATLRQRFATDDALWVDRQDKLFYVDPAPERAPLASDVLTAPVPTPLPDVETLHSRPGAARTILLDFDGHDDIGGAWSAGYTGDDGVAEAYVPKTAGLEAEIYDIWRRVSEDFAPFDVDVTTEDADPEKINRASSTDLEFGTRVVLTSTATDCRCGGVAYVGVFDQYGSARTQPHAYYQPAFVYNAGAKAAAEAASHEAGHNLGLSHDGTAQQGYYAGHGEWAPIMGVGYYEPVSQWSRGEYAGASNTEDDFAVAQRNGAPVETDQDGTAPTAVAIGSSRTGVLSGAADVDRFSFTVGTEHAGSHTLEVVPSAVSPNADLRIDLYRDGALVASADPASGPVAVLDADGETVESTDRAAGLYGRLRLALSSGSYELRVRGVGKGDPRTTGYSSYGSVGAYAVTVTPGGTADAPLIAPAPVTAALASSTTAAVSWPDVDGETGYEVQRRAGTTGTWVGLTAPLTASDVTSLVDRPASGSYQYRVRAVGPSGASAWTAESALVTVGGKTGGPKRR